MISFFTSVNIVVIIDVWEEDNNYFFCITGTQESVVLFSKKHRFGHKSETSGAVWGHGDFYTVR